MSKKLWVILAIVIILIVGICAYGFFNQTMKVGSATFDMPNGYHKGTPNYLGSVNITKENHTIFFTEYTDSNVMKYINDYKKLIFDDRNQTVEISNYTIGDNLIYKGVIKENPLVVHSWFVKDNNTYDIYTWDGNKDLDNVVINCVQS